MDTSYLDIAGRYLRIADRLLPGRIVGFYVVGSAALGAYRPGRSDVDFVAVLDRDLEPGDLRRIRAAQVASGTVTAAGLLRRHDRSLAGTCNGVFVALSELQRPVTSIRPAASHAGHELHGGRAFDVNPVMWKVLAERGIALRGRLPSELGLNPEPSALVDWNLANLNRYWRRWAETAVRGRRANSRVQGARWCRAWGALGAPRLHCTIATGEVISKEAAGEYAREAFDARWHPVIDDALGYWRMEPADPSDRSDRAMLVDVGAFVLDVIRSANTTAA